MIKTTYVPNMIGIPTNAVDLWHHGLRLGERNPKSAMELLQGERGERKKERRKKDKEGRRFLGGLVTPKGLA
jgi:hypothetical protein